MLNTDAKFNVGAVVQGDNSDVADLGISKASVNKAIAIALTHGAAAGNINRFYADKVTISGTEEDIDLLTALDAVGVAMNLNKLKGILIENGNEVTDGELEVGFDTDGTAGNAVSLFNTPDDSCHLIPKGGVYFFYTGPNGITVDGTHKVLRIAGSDGNQFDIVIVGADTS